MAKKADAESTAKTPGRKAKEFSLARQTGEGRGEGRPSALLDTRVVYCGDNLEQLARLPDACVDLIFIDPLFNSSRNYSQRPDWHSLWGESKEKRAFEVHRMAGGAS